MHIFLTELEGTQSKDLINSEQSHNSSVEQI